MKEMQNRIGHHSGVTGRVRYVDGSLFYAGLPDDWRSCADTGIFNVLGFGTNGNGTNNDTVAIQKAVSPECQLSLADRPQLPMLTLQVAVLK
jgi:hypothetical protein